MVRAAGPLCWSFFVVATVPFRCQAQITLPWAPNCKPNFGNLWHGRGTYEAALLEGAPSVRVPDMGKGFNRTLDLDGFCNNVLYQAANFDCRKNDGGEWRAQGKAGQALGVFARFDGINCPLSGIALHKSEDDSSAEIRFEFDGCGPPESSPVSSAAVVMELTKVSGMQSGLNLVPWMDEVCSVAVSTTPKVNIIQIGTKFHEKELVGDGKCKGPGKKRTVTMPNVTNHLQTHKDELHAACQGICSYDTTIAENTGKMESRCTGFSINPKEPLGEDCITYNGSLSEIEANSGWKCWTMKVADSDYGKITPAPTSQNPSITGSLEIDQALPTAGPLAPTVAKLFEFHALKPSAEHCCKDKQECFAPMWWFQMQDESGKPATLGVHETEWDALMAMLPKKEKLPAKLEKGMGAKLEIDRVLVKTCRSVAGWGRSCVMPKVEVVCDNQQMVNSIVTGLLVPILGWLCVFGWARANGIVARGKRDVDIADDKRVPQCSIGSMLCCCIVAIVACGGIAFGSSALISFIFGATGCLHGQREMIVIGCAAGVPGAVAIIFGILYVYCSGKSKRSAEPVKPSKKKIGLAMVESDGQGSILRGNFLNPDIMGTGSGAVAALDMANNSSQINIDASYMNSMNSGMASGSFGSGVNIDNTRNELASGQPDQPGE